MIPHIDKHPWSNDIALHLAMVNNGERALATNVTFTILQPGIILPPAPITFSQAEAQNLADQLYEAGIRPSAAAGSAGQLDAVKYHLEDLRKLVFKVAQR